MLQQCRYISARTLLGLTKFDRCQSLLSETWTPVERLWHLVFISHRWGSQDDPDPSGKQLEALKRLVWRMVDIAGVIGDERVSAEAVRDRLARVPSLARQGNLQAAHLVFRTLCGGSDLAANEVARLEGDGILDLIGFWYDFSCLPQDPRTVDEEREFGQALQGIGEMILSPRVSTLVLRREKDGYLERGWCFAESMIAGAKEDVFMPMILRTDRWDEPLAMELSGGFGALRPEVMGMLGLWEDLAVPVLAEKAFASAVNGTAMLMLAKMDSSMSEFVVGATATMSAGLGLFAGIQSSVALLAVGDRLDLSVDLVNVLRREGLGCRDERDYILVALLLMKSLTAINATEDLGIWWEALERFMEGRSLILVRRDGMLTWQD